MSYLDRGQAAARLDCSIESNILAPTLIDVKLQGGLALQPREQMGTTVHWNLPVWTRSLVGKRQVL